MAAAIAFLIADDIPPVSQAVGAGLASHSDLRAPPTVSAVLDTPEVSLSVLIPVESRLSDAGSRAATRNHPLSHRPSVRTPRPCVCRSITVWTIVTPYSQSAEDRADNRARPSRHTPASLKAESRLVSIGIHPLNLLARRGPSPSPAAFAAGVATG